MGYAAMDGDGDGRTTRGCDPQSARAHQLHRPECRRRVSQTHSTIRFQTPSLDATNCPLKSHRLLSAASPNRTRPGRQLLTLDSVRLHLFIPQTSPALLLIPLGFLSILCLGPSSLLVRLVLGVSIVSFQSKRGKSAHKKTGHTCAIYTPPLQNLDTTYLHSYIQQGIFAHNNRQHVRPHSKGRYARHPRGKGHDPC